VADVMKTLHGMKIHDAFARNATLRADGKLVHDVYLVTVKTPAESKRAWDYYKIAKTVPGEQAFAPLTESKCPLVSR
jgi:branched-chain amino acid transport system substrate-binding protein